MVHHSFVMNYFALRCVALRVAWYEEERKTAPTSDNRPVFTMTVIPRKSGSGNEPDACMREPR
jgi:hypothetical protein